MNPNQTLQEKFPHLEVSVLKLSEVQKDNATKRIDSEYFKKEYLENEERLKKFDCLSLEELSNFITNGHTPYGENLLENEVKFITAEFIDDFLIHDVKKFISLDSHFHYLKRSVLQNGDVIFSIKGKIGNAVPIFDIKENININQDVARLSIDTKQINIFYLCAFLNSKFGKKQTEYKATGQINPFIALGALKTLKIPLLPMSFQLEIEKLVKDSHEYLEQSKALYKEAEDLLYAELGLDPQNPLDSVFSYFQFPTRPFRGAEHWEKGGSSASANAKLEMDMARHSPISEKAAAFLRAGERGEGAALFAIRENKKSIQGNKNITSCNPPNCTIKTLKESFLKTGRLDSEYYQVKYDLMEDKLKSKGFKILEEICSLINYGSVPTSPYSENDEGVPYIKGLNLKNLIVDETKLDKITNTQDLDSKFFTKENDIIISQMGTVGDAGIVRKEQENYIFASFTIRIRLKDTKEFNPYFVGMYIQHIAKEWYLYRHIAQASVRQNTDLPTIKNLYVPLVDIKIQEQIASHIQQSFTLRAEAKALLEEAKAKVESAISAGGGGK